MLQELGGKSPSVVLESADIGKAVQGTLMSVLVNSGQSCIAPTRMLVPASKQAEAIEAAKAMMAATQTGDPMEEGRHIGPLVNKAQFDKVQGLIRTGMGEGAKLEIGGPGRPDGVETGYFVKPTLFSGVTNDMTIAREEIFGPCTLVMPFDSEEEVIKRANSTCYGLAASIYTQNVTRAHRVASRMEVGLVWVNSWFLRDLRTPFGGAKQSGIGREGGVHSLEFYTELKNICIKL